LDEKMSENHLGQISEDACVSKGNRNKICKTCAPNEYCHEIESHPWLECREREDPCDTNPCQNGGKCQSDMSDSSVNPAPFECTCPNEYFGEFCQSKIECKGQTPIVFDEKQSASKFCKSFKGFDGKVIEHSGDLHIKSLGQRPFISERFRQAKQLIMERGKIEKLEASAFKDLPDLRQVKFGFNKISKIADDIFEKDMKKLRIVDFSHNNLEDVPSKVFKSSIKEIYLNDNRDLTVSASTFKNLKNARKIHIWGVYNGPLELQEICKKLVEDGKVKKGGCCWMQKKEGPFKQKRSQCE